MTDTPADPPPYIAGPGPDYDPPPLTDLIDPSIREQTAAKGRDLVLTVLSDRGITKRDDGKWDTPNTTDRGARG